MQAITSDELDSTVRAAVEATLGPRMDELRRFLDRRVAELSAELHATQELAELGENNLAMQIAAIHRQIADMTAPPTAATRNSGTELEAVVVATENAANRIMEAAEAIADWIDKGERDPAALRARVNTIFEACSFQDLTGQRLRRAIEHLQQVEGMLDRLAAKVPLPEDAVLPERVTSTGGTGHDVDQSEIDRLLGF